MSSFVAHCTGVLIIQGVFLPLLQLSKFQGLHGREGSYFFQRAQGRCLKKEAKSNEHMPRELKLVMMLCGVTALTKAYVHKCTTETWDEFWFSPLTNTSMHDESGDPKSIVEYWACLTILAS